MGRTSIVAAMMLTILLVPTITFAQMGNFDLKFDPSTATTVSGTVLTFIDYNVPNPSTGPRLAVIQTPSNEIYKVFLAPGWYLDQLGLNLAQGTKVTVNGSMRSIAGNNYLVASSIGVGDKTYTIRSASGLPLGSCSSACGPGMAPATVVVPTPPLGSGPCAAPMVIPAFDPKTVVREYGVIDQVYQIQTNEGSEPVLVAVLKDTSRSGDVHTYNVLLGPMSFLSGSGISFHPGQYIEVHGSEVDMAGLRMLIATTVKQGNIEFNVRSDAGAPLWTQAGTPSPTMSLPAPQY
jgi:hypothetical protein